MICNCHTRPERDTTRYCLYISLWMVPFISLMKNPDVIFKKIRLYRKILCHFSGSLKFRTI